MSVKSRRKPEPKTDTHWPSLLRHHRFTNNMKQAALAQDLGVTQAMISRWESGRSEPSPAMQDSIRDLVDEAARGTPMVHWREASAQQPAMVAIVNTDGVCEVASRGFLRDFRLERHEVEGQPLGSLFSGDAMSLYEAMKASGFFEGRVELVESADILKCKRPGRPAIEHCVHGLHWPGRDDAGRIHWVASGARISRDEFEDMRNELGGQLVMKLTK